MMRLTTLVGVDPSGPLVRGEPCRERRQSPVRRPQLPQRDADRRPGEAVVGNGHVGRRAAFLYGNGDAPLEGDQLRIAVAVEQLLEQRMTRRLERLAVAE